MTILKSFLTFNQPQKLIECPQCNGTGKIKTSRMTAGTIFFCFGLGMLFFILLMSLRQGFIYLVSFIFILSVYILTLKEQKEQSANQVDQNKKSNSKTKGILK